jgi:hypothetical protein
VHAYHIETRFLKEPSLKKHITPILVLATLMLVHVRADDPIFSGPQVGEKLANFKVRGFFEPNSGKELDFVKQAAGQPIILIFIHDANRPSLLITKFLTNYTVELAAKGLATGVVWLTDDVSEAENRLKRSGHALTKEAPTGISLDGNEGPGSYGLNRNVTLTILIGKEGRVTANFALVQPSIQADLPKILQEVAKVTGGVPATLEDLLIVSNTRLQYSLSVLDQKSAKPEEIDAEAVKIVALVERDEEARKELAKVASRLVGSGRLPHHGTPHSQNYFRQWAEKYGSGKTP